MKNVNNGEVDIIWNSLVNSTDYFQSALEIADKELEDNLTQKALNRTPRNGTFYDRKVVICGNNVEVYEYEHKQEIGRQKKTQPKGREIEFTEQDQITLNEILDQQQQHEENMSENEQYTQTRLEYEHEQKIRQQRELDRKKKYRNDAMRRAKTNLKRLINSNVFKYYDNNRKPFTPVFVTLTFRPLPDGSPMTDVTYAYECFTKFKKELDRLYKDDLLSQISNEGKIVKGFKYAGVVEFQKNGAVHFHVIFFNLPYIDNTRLAEIWGQGFIKMNAVKNKKTGKLEFSKYIDEDGNLQDIPNGKRKSIDNLGNYVTKYMQKDMDDERLCGQKCYFTSKGLLKPIVTVEDTSLPKETIDETTGELRGSTVDIDDSFQVYTSEYNGEYTGKVTVKHYFIK